MRVLVTGATGLLGGHLLAALRRAGHDVIALHHRRPGDREDVTWVRGDVSEPSRWWNAVGSVDVVFHLASLYREVMHGEVERDEAWRVNVQGTAKLFESSTPARFVFISSAGVVSSTLESPATADSPFATGLNLYFASKAAAERVLTASEGAASRLTIVRSSMMLGPNDPGPTPAGSVLRDHLSQGSPVAPPVRLVVSDARDVAAALVRTLDLEPGGPPLLLGGHGLTFMELFERLETTVGTPAPHRQPPYPIAWLLTWFGQIARRARGRPPARTTGDLARMRSLGPPDDSDARARLGFTLRPLEATLRDTARWFTREAPGPGDSRDHSPAGRGTSRRAGRG